MQTKKKKKKKKKKKSYKKKKKRFPRYGNGVPAGIKYKTNVRTRAKGYRAFLRGVTFLKAPCVNQEIT